MIKFETINEEINKCKTWEQLKDARRFWTQYCEENDLEVDTRSYDLIIFDIWIVYLYTSPLWTPKFKNYEQFYEFMCVDLV